MRTNFANGHLDHESFSELVGLCISYPGSEHISVIVGVRRDDLRQLWVSDYNGANRRCMDWNTLTQYNRVDLTPAALVKLANEFNAIAELESKHRQDRDTAERALDTFQGQLKEVAVRYTSEHGFCDQVSNALEELGIDPTVRRTYCVEITVSVDVRLGDNVEHWEIEQAISNGSYTVVDYNEEGF